MLEDEILEPKEVAKRLKVSYRTVVRLADRGVLPGFRMGDLWRFRARDIEKYIDDQMKPRPREQGE